MSTFVPTASTPAASSDKAPLVDVSVTKVRCPGNNAGVVMSAGEGEGQVGFTVRRDGAFMYDGLLNPSAKRTVDVNVGSRKSAEIAVEIEGQGTANYKVTSGCAGKRHNRQGKAHALPRTGPPADLMGKIATAGGLVLTGGVIWWFGVIWPRPRPDTPICVDRSRYGRRRYPNLKL
ncbi:hypothetical protein [Sinosporangium siamense]|uniref:Uncharacterized protein n=1 Tax=Sinosporangium siamense TaxID=1367973 RepID=A0A919RCA6_9ACTN|nr:hypothetical protein [Sinosporangium siamense]GII91300.1 hypothetical protein Ssi02_15310 [Sinosporangium siamense]